MLLTTREKIVHKITKNRCVPPYIAILKHNLLSTQAVRKAWERDGKGSKTLQTIAYSVTSNIYQNNPHFTICLPIFMSYTIISFVEFKQYPCQLPNKLS
jgi:hypothetical protein